MAPYLDIGIRALTNLADAAARRALQINQDVYNIVIASRHRIPLGENGYPTFPAVRNVLDPNISRNDELHDYLDGRRTLTREDFELKDMESSHLIISALRHIVNLWPHVIANRQGGHKRHNVTIPNGIVCKVKTVGEDCRNVTIDGLCADAYGALWCLSSPPWDNQNSARHAIIYLNDADQLRLKLYEPKYRPTAEQKRRAAALERALTSRVPKARLIRGNVVQIHCVPYSRLVRETFQRIFGPDVFISYVRIDNGLAWKLKWPSGCTSPSIHYRLVLTILNSIGEGSSVPVVMTELNGKRLVSKPRSKEAMRKRVDRTLDNYERSSASSDGECSTTTVM